MHFSFSKSNLNYPLPSKWRISALSIIHWFEYMYFVIIKIAMSSFLKNTISVAYLNGLKWKIRSRHTLQWIHLSRYANIKTAIMQSFMVKWLNFLNNAMIYLVFTLQYFIRNFRAITIHVESLKYLDDRRKGFDFRIGYFVCSISPFELFCVEV